MNTNTESQDTTENVLQYLVKKPTIQSATTPLLILLHGVGSNEKDLFSLADQLPGNFLIVSVRAPNTLRAGSYAWFDVDFATGKPVINPQQAEASRKLLIDFISHLKQEQQFDSAQVYMLGFSQGGIMAYSTGLTRPDLIKGIAVLSGRLLPEVKPLIVAKEKLQQLKVFIAHGIQDNKLTVQYAREANSFLQSLTIQPAYKEYNEGHTINKDELNDVIAWLKG